MEVPLQHVIGFVAPNPSCKSFNPCFNGSSSSTKNCEDSGMKRSNVSILVLMEVPLQQATQKNILIDKYVSILVLMEVPLQLSLLWRYPLYLCQFQSLF